MRGPGGRNGDIQLCRHVQIARADHEMTRSRWTFWIRTHNQVTKISEWPCKEYVQYSPPACFGDLGIVLQNRRGAKQPRVMKDAGMAQETSRGRKTDDGVFRSVACDGITIRTTWLQEEEPPE